MGKDTMKKPMKLPDCKHCYDKRYYSVLIGTYGAEDFVDGDGFTNLPSIKNVACPKCNKRNRRRIKGVQKTIWF